jgi:hypothetical protein
LEPHESLIQSRVAAKESDRIALNKDLALGSFLKQIGEGLLNSLAAPKHLAMVFVIVLTLRGVQRRDCFRVALLKRFAEFLSESADGKFVCLPVLIRPGLLGPALEPGDCAWLQ